MAIKYSLEAVQHSEQHSLAHSLLKDMLKGFYNIDYTEEMTKKAEQGKPYLADYPDVYFNISHSEGITACMVEKSQCGIDCEKVREYRPNVMKRAFSAKEREMIENAPENERDLLFFTVWTLKEAYIKAIGKGLSYPMNEAEFFIEDGNIISNIKDYEFRRYIIEGGKFVMATAVKNNS
ncbi:MAG: 4'-phosphopantetheinyl transferase superfamily protein [Ruminococcus sp.]|nr:4'-phosphopantetheinyl transferase superfamily protein [Ruminococcus sp.]